MLRMKRSKRGTKDRLNAHLAARVALLGLFISACGSVNVKKRNEVWKINASELLLYRVVSDKEEEVIPILENPDMKKFMCISGDEFDDFVQELTRQ